MIDLNDMLFTRISSRIELAEKRSTLRLDALMEQARSLTAAATRSEARQDMLMDARVKGLRNRFDARLDELHTRLDDLARAQKQMAKTLELIRAAVVLGPDAVRYAMAWDGPPPFVMAGAAPGSPAARPVADSANTSSRHD